MKGPLPKLGLRLPSPPEPGTQEAQESSSSRRPSQEDIGDGDLDSLIAEILGEG